MNKIYVKDLIKKFNFKIINYGDIKNNVITSLGIARLGIVLATNIKPLYKTQTNIVCFGVSELNYFNNISSSEFKKSLNKIVKLKPPLLLLNKAFNRKDIKKILYFFKNTSTTIACTKLDSVSLYFELTPWLAKKMSPVIQIHGTLVTIYGLGVLIIGESGCGKSETAMELLKNGHLFVGDDAIDVYNFGSFLYGKPNPTFKNFIEIRGLGILDISKMFGKQKILNETRIDVVIQLIDVTNKKNKSIKFKRISDVCDYEIIKNVKIPKYRIPISLGKTIANLVEWAIVDYKLKIDGYNSCNEMFEKFYKKF